MKKSILLMFTVCVCLVTGIAQPKKVANNSAIVNNNNVNSAQDSIIMVAQQIASENNLTSKVTPRIMNGERLIIPEMKCSILLNFKKMLVSTANERANARIIHVFYEGTSEFIPKNEKYTITIINYVSNADDKLKLGAELYSWATKLNAKAKHPAINLDTKEYKTHTWLGAADAETFTDMKKNWGTYTYSTMDLNSKRIYTIVFKVNTLYEDRFKEQYTAIVDSVLAGFTIEQ